MAAYGVFLGLNALGMLLFFMKGVVPMGTSQMKDWRYTIPKD